MQPQTKHQFVDHHFGSPTFCLCCRSFIWGLGRQGKRCKNCHYAVHKRCVHKVEKFTCNQYLRAVEKKQARIEHSLKHKMSFDEKSGHEFNAKHFNHPVACDVCDDLIFGVGRQGLRCDSCKMTIHYRCLGSVKWQSCPKKRKEKVKRAKKSAPPGFEIRSDPVTGKLYYFEISTGRSYKDLPQHVKEAGAGAGEVLMHSIGLPPGWEMRIENETGEVFYVDHTTKTTTWIPPPIPNARRQQKEPSPYLTLEQQAKQLEIQQKQYQRMSSFYSQSRYGTPEYNESQGERAMIEAQIGGDAGVDDDDTDEGEIQAF